MSVHASLKECSVPIKTDFLSKRENEVPAEHEILIGKPTVKNRSMCLIRSTRATPTNYSTQFWP